MMTFEIEAVDVYNHDLGEYETAIRVLSGPATGLIFVLKEVTENSRMEREDGKDDVHATIDVTVFERPDTVSDDAIHAVVTELTQYLVDLDNEEDEEDPEC